MRVLYLTTYVLGDSGANAADIFPRLAAESPEIERVYVADFPRNKYHIEARQGARYLRLEWHRTWLRHAARIARKCKQERIDILHVFYRQQNAVLLILIRAWLLLLGAQTRIVMDHRSVNLAKGWRARRKRALNAAMQLCTHALAGNPWAVETNHWTVFRPKHLVDLGYDVLPEGVPAARMGPHHEVIFWFIGTLKPRNRQSEFLLDVFEAVAARTPCGGRRIRFHVAGPAREDQIDRLRAAPNVTYHGKLPRAELYRRLRRYPGVGLAFMNHRFHEYAPSLKFAEYAIMRYDIIASDTVGLTTQAARMNLPGQVRFVPETVADWTDAILAAAHNHAGPTPPWADAALWSYPAIFERQVLGLYRELAAPRARSGSQQEIALEQICDGQTFDKQHIAITEIQTHPR
jgi:glycosyltransferase involved in cell wall biosynthesis